MRFSERYGYRSIRELVQLDSIDEPLRNALWNALTIFVWDKARISTGMYAGYYLSSAANEPLSVLCKRLWLHHFKLPLDQLDNNWKKVLPYLRNHFYECQWFEAYDFVEFVAQNYDGRDFLPRFTQTCNAHLERELSAYRFVDGVLTRITEQQELEEVDQAVTSAEGPVRLHLRRSLELLSDRDAPDYRNSIKESISALEGLVALVLGSEKGTLGQLVKKLDDEIGLHPALRSAISNLYGYTSDEGGIRHALLEAEVIKFEDAKFFLVVCSAFINFVQAKR